MATETKIAIIGAGPAGMAASIALSQLNVQSDIYYVDRIGGQLNEAVRVSNYVGIPDVVSGENIIERIKTQAINSGANFIKKEIQAVNFNVRPFILQFDDRATKEYEAVVISTGKCKNTPTIRNIDKYYGRGVSTCVSCDGHFFRNKTVAVVGSGDSAIKCALFISDIATNVFVLIRGGSLKCSTKLSEVIKKKNNIDIRYNTIVESIEGNNIDVENIIVKDNKQEYKLKIDGLFILIGSGPNTDIFKEYIKVDEKGYIITDTLCRTNVPGVLACGDVQAGTYKQASIAVGNGYTAGMSTAYFLQQDNVA